MAHTPLPPHASDNPKGQLLEFCARAKCTPVFDSEESGRRFGARVSVVIDGETFDSGVHWALERTLAEQRASAALLAELAAVEDEGDVGEWVAEDEAARLRTDNPKGALLEHCVRLHITPQFDVRPVVTVHGSGFEATVHVEIGGEELWSDVRRATTAKSAEQAAAASLLARLRAAAGAPTVSTLTASEPRSVLNEMRQKNALRDYGFAVARTEGPPHATVFHMTAFAVRADGTRVDVAGIAASSKKEGERAAALRLLEQLGP